MEVVPWSQARLQGVAKTSQNVFDIKNKEIKA